MAKRGPYKTKPAEERFWRFIDRRLPEECWPWTGFRYNPAGKHWNGQFRFEGKAHLAHRVAFKLEHGRWPEPCCLHRCDNGLCVNPAHLFEGTKAENTADMLAKGREQRGAARWNAKLNEQDALDIRANYALCRVTQTELAERYRVMPSVVSRIVNGKAWRGFAAPQKEG